MGLWSTSAGELLSPKSDSHTGPVLAIAYADDGRSIVTAGDDATVRLWDAADGRQRWAKPFDRTDWVDVMALSRDGALIAASGSTDVPEAGVRILRTATGDEVRHIPMNAKRFQRRVHALVF
ncbi:MAG TPA: WD40 repeat domain-containing protein, partial [Pirellulales bacterium]|nr:WD40 repeat domain-containing protein [Pirellulales bacterium]